MGELGSTLGGGIARKTMGKSGFDFGGYMEGCRDVFIDILLGFPGPSDGLRLHSTVFFSSGSGLTADSSVLTLTLAFLDFGLDFAQSFPFHAQFCHFGLVPVAPKVGAAAVASPVDVLELDTYSSSEISLPPVYVASMVEEQSCITIIITYYFYSRDPYCSHSTHHLLLEDIPIGRLYRTHPGGPCRAFTARKSVIPLPSHHLVLRHFISGHSLSGHASPDTTVADSSTPPRFVYPPLARTPRCSEAYLHWRSPTATVTSSIHATRSLVPSRADLVPPCKRYRDSISPEDSVEEDIDANELADIEAYATADEVAVDRDVEAGVNAGIGMEVDVRVDVEDKVEDKVESSDRGTMEVGVDMVFEIDILNGMLMPDAVECLEQVEEGLQDIYEHVMEIPLHRIEDIKKGQRELEVRSLIAEHDYHSFCQSQNDSDGDNGNGGNGNGGDENCGNGNGGNRNPNGNNRGVRPVARETVGTEAAFAMSWRELMKLMAEVYCPRNEIQKIESELWNLTVKNNDLAAYTQRFQELTMMCTKMVPEEEDRVEKFIGGLPETLRECNCC
ncbi:putative reverse transcriptase domain-containing protein [Tanacetum coccineum]